MKYMGSKDKYARTLIPLIMKGRKKDQYYVEPFVGGGNMIDKVNGNRIGSDYNKIAIHALMAVRDNLRDIPKNNKEFTELDYTLLRENKDTLVGYQAFASFAYSFGGKFLGGWGRGLNNKKIPRDYVAESYRNAVIQSPKLSGVQLINRSYDDLKIPDNSIIYCDPPYTGTTKYSHEFDHDKFYVWCREMHRQGHKIFISEYSMPDDFKLVWSKEVASSLTVVGKRKREIEKLYTL